MGYAFTTKGYRIWIPEDDKIVESINVNFKEDSFYQDKDSSSITQDGAVLGTPVKWHIGNGTEEIEPDSEGTVDGPVETSPGHPIEPQDFSSGEETSDDEGPRLKHATWVRKVVPRPDGTRNDIYYYEKGKTTRLRSHTDAKRYCKKFNLIFDESLFNFRGKDKFHGEIVSQLSETES